MNKMLIELELYPGISNNTSLTKCLKNYLKLNDEFENISSENQDSNE